MTFSLHSVRFRFEALDPIRFPEGQAGNLLRGAFGTAFRKMACAPECPGRGGANVRECPSRAECLYAQIFEPAAIAPGPSGLSDHPRPFVIRAWHLNGRVFHPGEAFCFQVHMFQEANPPVEQFRRAFQAMAAEGFAADGGKASLVHMEVAPLSIPLDPPEKPVSRVHVDFRSPAQLKSGAKIVSRPEFAVLFARARDRVSSLRALYGRGPLPIDFRALGERSQAVQIARCDLETVEAMRRSSRSGQRHGIGGFVGSVEYEGDLGEFVPYLTAAHWTGVGRHCSWGNGEISIEASVETSPQR